MSSAAIVIDPAAELRRLDAAVEEAWAHADADAAIRFDQQREALRRKLMAQSRAIAAAREALQ